MALGCTVLAVGWAAVFLMTKQCFAPELKLSPQEYWKCAAGPVVAAGEVAARADTGVVVSSPAARAAIGVTIARARRRVDLPRRWSACNVRSSRSGQKCSALVIARPFSGARDPTAWFYRGMFGFRAKPWPTEAPEADQAAFLRRPRRTGPPFGWTGWRPTVPAAGRSTRKAGRS